MSARRTDVAVVGAGPAGIAAACRAAEAGQSVTVLDEGFGPGGQIWRSPPDAPPPPKARPWIERLERSGATVLRSASVYEVAREAGAWRVRAEWQGRRVEVASAKLVAATGARELLLPFDGWTLPGVTGAAGAQALAHSGWNMAGKRIVLAGTGPLLLAVGAGLQQDGAEVVRVLEQAPFAALAALSGKLLLARSKLLDAVRYRAALGARYRSGWWVVGARGGERVEAAVITDGRRTETIPCDVLAVSWGLVPNVELPAWLGARLDCGAVSVGPEQETSIPGLYCAGETCGIAGAEVALVEGQIAGLAAAGRAPEPELAAARSAGRAFAAAMDRAFAIRSEVLAPHPDLVLCRCEDVRVGEVDRAWSPRQAKLYTRAGMGACQGRVCGAALARLYGWAPDAVRVPCKPVLLSTLAQEEADDAGVEERAAASGRSGAAVRRKLTS